MASIHLKSRGKKNDTCNFFLFFAFYESKYFKNIMLEEDFSMPTLMRNISSTIKAES